MSYAPRRKATIIIFDRRSRFVGLPATRTEAIWAHFSPIRAFTQVRTTSWHLLSPESSRSPLLLTHSTLSLSACINLVLMSSVNVASSSRNLCQKSRPICFCFFLTYDLILGHLSAFNLVIKKHLSGWSESFEGPLRFHRSILSSR